MNKKKNPRPVISNYDTLELLKSLGACWESQDYVKANPDLDLDQLWTRCKNESWKDWLADVTVGYEFRQGLNKTVVREWCGLCQSYSCSQGTMKLTPWSRRKLKAAVIANLTA